MAYKAFKVLIAILGVLSSAFGVYSFLFQNNKSQIIYSMNQYKVTDKNVSSDLNIYDNKNERILDDIYISYIYIWNSGSKRIVSADVLRPVSIKIGDGARFLDVQVASQTHPDIIKANIAYSNMEATVHFENIEPGFGFKIKALYSSKTNPHIIFSGLISESPDVREVFLKESEKYKSKFFIYEIIFIFIFCSVTGYISVKILSRLLFEKMTEMNPKVSLISILVISAIAGATSTIIANKFANYGYGLYSPSPPTTLLGS